MLKRLSLQVGALGHELMEISESEDTSWRTSRVLASIGQPLIYLSALLAGDFEWLRDAFLGLGEPT